MNPGENSKTIFYSWQSDLRNRNNRTFIQDALQKAIDGILQTELELEIAIDRDTQNVPGAPDISQTILSKIDVATVFVADISIINAGSDGRLTPNPNVLFELGYAVHALSWNNVLPIFNLATGRIEDLPFDLRSRRPLSYAMSDDVQEKAPELKKFARVLQSAIELIVTKQKEQKPRVRFVLRRLPYPRLSLQNNGATSIQVVKFIIEYPRSIQMNGFAFAHLPILRVEEQQFDDATPTFRQILVRSEAPIANGEPDNWRLPPKIEPGETEIFEYPNLNFKADAPLDSKINLRLSFDQGNPLVIETTLGELLDPVGRFAI